MGKHSVIVLWSKRLSEGLGLPVSHGAVRCSKTWGHRLVWVKFSFHLWDSNEGIVKLKGCWPKLPRCMTDWLLCWNRHCFGLRWLLIINSENISTVSRHVSNTARRSDRNRLVTENWVKVCSAWCDRTSPTLHGAVWYCILLIKCLAHKGCLEWARHC